MIYSIGVYGHGESFWLNNTDFHFKKDSMSYTYYLKQYTSHEFDQTDRYIFNCVNLYLDERDIIISKQINSYLLYKFYYEK